MDSEKNVVDQDPVEWWSRWIMRAIVLTAVSGAVYVLYKYYQAFNGFFPTTTEKLRGDFGQTGDFVGGLLNPIFAFASFVALLYTIRLQTKEMKSASREARASANALKAQVEHMRKETNKNDLNRVISMVSHEINKAISDTIPLGSANHGQISVSNLFGKNRSREHYDNLPSWREETRPNTKEAIDDFADSIKELAMSLYDYKKNDGDRSITIYYSRRYGVFAQALYEKGYINEKCKNVFDFSMNIEEEPSPTSYTDTSPQPQETP